MITRIYIKSVIHGIVKKKIKFSNCLRINMCQSIEIRVPVTMILTYCTINNSFKFLITNFSRFSMMLGNPSNPASNPN